MKTERQFGKLMLVKFVCVHAGVRAGGPACGRAGVPGLPPPPKVLLNKH